MADYYPLINKAVAGLDKSTGEAHRALYERARTALVTQLRGVQPGFRHPEEIQILHSRIPEAITTEPERVMRMQNEILDKLAAIPGVVSVGFANAAPLESFLAGMNPVDAEDKRLAEGQVPPPRQIRKIAPIFLPRIALAANSVAVSSSIAQTPSALAM